MENDVILRLERLSFAYDKPLIRDFSLELHVGERICLSAASGKGKTTLLRLIAGLERPMSGEVMLNGEVRYLFQEDRLLPWYTVERNLRLVEPERERVREALAEVGLDGRAGAYPSELSGGMRRRAAIARLLLLPKAERELLLLDEPFGGIDSATSERTRLALERRFRDAAWLLVTHKLDEARDCRARVIYAEFLPRE